MNDWKERVSRLSSSSKLPVPRTLVEVVGRERVLIEHHRGIKRYEPETIHVGTTYGRLSIIGKRLRLCCMTAEQLIILGNIEGIDFEGSDS